LVQFAIDHLKNHANPSVLDLGTGSGCIAVSIAHKCKTAEVLATDISPDALAVAEKNSRKNGVEGRIRFLKGDLFSAVPEGTKFNLIVSNPPYIAPAEIETLAPDVKDHEPRLALDGGPDGLAYYRRIAAEAKRFLSAGGVVALEIGYQQDEAVRGILTSQGGWNVGSTLRDMAGRTRVVVAKAA
jgi:release factor glutamine methyltransferase